MLPLIVGKIDLRELAAVVEKTAEEVVTVCIIAASDDHALLVDAGSGAAKKHSPGPKLNVEASKVVCASATLGVNNNRTVSSTCGPAAAFKAFAIIIKFSRTLPGKPRSIGFPRKSLPRSCVPARDTTTRPPFVTYVACSAFAQSASEKPRGSEIAAGFGEQVP